MGNSPQTIRVLLSLGGASGITFGLFMLMTNMLPQGHSGQVAATPPGIRFITHQLGENPKVRQRATAPKLAPVRRPPGASSLQVPDLRITAAAQLQVTPPLDRQLVLSRLVRPDALEMPGLGGEYMHADGLIPRVLMPPMYPPKGLSRGLAGEVIVEFTVSPEGLVTAAHIVFAKPEDIFNDATLQAVSHWRFQPVLIDGKPATITARQTISFNLADEEG